MTIGEPGSVYFEEDIIQMPDSKYNQVLSASDGKQETSLFINNMYSIISLSSDYDWFEVYEWDCETACSGARNLGLWHIEYYADLSQNLIQLNYTFPSAPEFLMT